MSNTEKESTSGMIQKDIVAAQSETRPVEGEDGRSKEWQSRGRINTEPQPEAFTNLERDFEPEVVPKKDEAGDEPAY